MIVIGGSLGGTRALQSLLQGLPQAFPLPVAVALHRHPDVDGTLCAALQSHSTLPVVEALDKDPIRPGCVFVSPADYHLLVEPTHFSLSTDEPVNHARPSLDVLFESAADVFGNAAICVVLTGASGDGAHGAAQIERRGGTVIVQDPSSAHSATMPAAALAATRAARVLPLERIAPLLEALARARTGRNA